VLNATDTSYVKDFVTQTEPSTNIWSA